MTIAGADEVALDLSLIKGGGGALLREKIVAQASRRELFVVDEEKLSPCSARAGSCRWKSSDFCHSGSRIANPPS